MLIMNDVLQNKNQTEVIPEKINYTVVPTDLGLQTPAADNFTGED